MQGFSKLQKGKAGKSTYSNGEIDRMHLKILS